MLFIGEELGLGGYAVDIAVDPVEGTNLVANGLPNSIAVMAIAERGGLLHAPDSYMEKLAVGHRAAPYVHIDAKVHDNLQAVANALERPIARIKLISDGDVDAAIATAVEGTGIHVAMGIGGAPEGVLAAAALKCLGGGFMGRLKPRNDEEAARAAAMGFGDLDRVLTMNDLVRAENIVFTATGITDGELLQGVQYHEFGATTQSLVMRSKSGTLRKVDASHALGKLAEFSSIAFG